jgi:hypothetical protein
MVLAVGTTKGSASLPSSSGMAFVSSHPLGSATSARGFAAVAPAPIEPIVLVPEFSWRRSIPLAQILEVKSHAVFTARPRSAMPA